MILFPNLYHGKKKSGRGQSHYHILVRQLPFILCVFCSVRILLCANLAENV